MSKRVIKKLKVKKIKPKKFDFSGYGDAISELLKRKKVKIPKAPSSSKPTNESITKPTSKSIVKDIYIPTVKQVYKPTVKQVYKSTSKYTLQQAYKDYYHQKVNNKNRVKRLVMSNEEKRRARFLIKSLVKSNIKLTAQQIDVLLTYQRIGKDMFEKVASKAEKKILKSISRSKMKIITTIGDNYRTYKFNEILSRHGITDLNSGGFQKAFDLIYIYGGPVVNSDKADSILMIAQNAIMELIGEGFTLQEIEERIANFTEQTGIVLGEDDICSEYEIKDKEAQELVIKEARNLVDEEGENYEAIAEGNDEVRKELFKAYNELITDYEIKQFNKAVNKYLKQNPDEIGTDSWVKTPKTTMRTKKRIAKEAVILAADRLEKKHQKTIEQLKLYRKIRDEFKKDNDD